MEMLEDGSCVEIYITRSEVFFTIHTNGQAAALLQGLPLRRRCVAVCTTSRSIQGVVIAGVGVRRLTGVLHRRHA
jgi:hypothetical protein